MMCRHPIAKSAIALVIGLLAIAPTGCSSNGLASVSGSMTYQGKPATGASVHFHREGETAEEAANFPIGIVDEDGTFYLETAGVGYGAVPGKYNVLVRWAPDKTDGGEPAPATTKNKKPRNVVKRSAAEIRRDPTSATDRLKFRYFNREKPLIQVEIKAGSNQLDPIELKD